MISFQYVAGASSYNSSGTVTVPIYLQETDPSGTVTVFGAPSTFNGLASTSFLITGAANGSSQITSVSSVTPMTGLPSSSTNLPTNTIDFYAGAALGTTNTGSSAISEGSNKYWFPAGSVTFNANLSTPFTLVSTANTLAATFSPNNANYGSDNTYTNAPSGGQDLDRNGSSSGVSWTGASSQSYTFTVGTNMSAPEPTSVGLLAIAACLGLVRRRRRAARDLSIP